LCEGGQVRGGVGVYLLYIYYILLYY